VGSTLWIRDLQRLEAVEIKGSGDAKAPFWSPDGEWLAYGQGNRLFKVPAAGGTPMAICDVPFVGLDGGTWGEDGILILAPNSGPMYSVSARGGDPKEVFPTAAGESDFHTPTSLPGGRGLLFTTHRNQGRDTIEVFAGGQRKVLLRIEGARLEHAAWAPSGHLVFHRLTTNNGIWAMPFDLDALEPTGEPFILAPDGAFPSVARDGSLLYALGGGGGMMQLVMVNRSGEITSTIGQPQAGMTWPELSPDGNAVLVSAQENDNRDIWMHDVERGTRTRMTFGPENDWTSIWMDGGKNIAFTNGSAQSNKTYVKPADGSGEPELFLEGYYLSVRDGIDLMAFDYFDQDTGDGIYYGPVDGSGEPQPFLQTRAIETGPQLSPDGQHIVYMSNESGANEVYLTTFPGGAGKWQVSTNGGAWPRWSRNGGEILYREGIAGLVQMMSVPVQTIPSLRLGTPVRVFSQTDVPGLVFGSGFRGYDVTADPDTFLMMQIAGDEEQHKPRLVYSENWYQDYRQKAE
jgi:serine/threonine-protein kinase